MWEKLGYQSIDPSVLSRVLQGKRFFTPKQLEVFCLCLGLARAQRQQLFEALRYDRNKLLGFNPDDYYFNHHGLIDLISRNLQLSIKLESTDLPEEAKEVAINTSNVIESLDITTFSEAQNKQLLTMLANLYYQLFFCDQVTHKKNTSWNHQRQIAKKILEIGYKVGSKQLIHKGLYALGDINYVNGKYEKAIPFFQASIVGSDDPFEFVALRSLAICFSNLAMENKVNEMETSITKKIQEFDYDIQVVCLEGISRAKAILGKGFAAYQYLDQAEAVHKKTSTSMHKSLRRIAIINAHLELGLKLKIKSETNTFHKLFLEGVKLPATYLRHGNKLKDFANQLGVAF